MKTHFVKLPLITKKQFEIINITDNIKSALADSGITEGIVTVFSPHTTAAVKINQDEPLLQQDIMKMLYRLVPLDTSYSHDLFELRQNIAANERSNGHAHVKSFLLGASETIAVQNSQLLLGSKQCVFFIELDGARSRQVFIQILGNQN